MHSATLTAKKDSKSYQGSVVVKYNVVPATVVDLKIDLKPTSPSTQVDIDYVGQIDKTIITPFFLSKELLSDMTEFKKQMANGIIETSATYCKMIIKKESYSYKPVFNFGVNENNINKYFYFDEFHPGMWFHQQMANHIINILQNN